MKYRVTWTTKRGGSGHGEPTTYDIAKAWAEEMSKKHPNIKHQVESVEE